MRLLMIIPLILATFWSVNADNCISETYSEEDFDFSEDIVQQRLDNISDEFFFSYHPDIKRYLQSYTTRGIREARVLIGKQHIYFPIFEYYLEKYNLPKSLKYLPLVESRLKPTAVSPKGAMGLWQLMSRTAYKFGLQINHYVDERKDPVKSTEAAVQYLGDLYNRFQDWPLALAAYNCGSYRVKKAIHYAGSRDFWKLRRYLPRETQQYIPAFIAAGYISNYYTLHNITPVRPHYAPEDIEIIKVHDYISFKSIARATHLSESTIYRLNPSYKRYSIPKNSEGNYLLLPQSAKPLFENFQANPPQTIRVAKAITVVDKKTAFFEQSIVNRTKSSYKVNEGDTMVTIAVQFKCRIKELMAWNDLDWIDLYPGQELVVYVK